ncbi:hypothetical protein HYU18_04480, partial [Candidatus Woesearchaeota archaeon]|nr:hypothetical protein [Candidatus Woesearchaeota archaeon]
LEAALTAELAEDESEAATGCTCAKVAVSAGTTVSSTMATSDSVLGTTTADCSSDFVF